MLAMTMMPTKISPKGTYSLIVPLWQRLSLTALFSFWRENNVDLRSHVPLKEFHDVFDVAEGVLADGAGFFAAFL
jgi:hypothetical protein